MHSLLHMGVCEQVLVAVFVIAVALRAVPELQIRVVKLCPVADRTPMSGASRVPGHLSLILDLPVHFLRRHPPVISRGEIEQKEVQKADHDGDPSCRRLPG